MGPDRQESWVSANIDEAGGFFTDPGYGRDNSEQYEEYVRACASACKCSVAKARSAFKRIRHNRARTSYRIVEVMTPAEAGELAEKVLKCATQEATFYEGTTEYVRFVYLKHPLGDTANEKASHLMGDPVIQKAIERCKEAMLDMSSRKRRRGDAMRLRGLKPRQIFVNVYPPRGEHSAPWHRDVDTVLGSAIVVLRGDSKDYVQLNGGARGVCSEAPEPGSAIVMSKNCEHAVPKRKGRPHTRVALVIWF